MGDSGFAIGLEGLVSDSSFAIGLEGIVSESILPARTGSS